MPIRSILICLIILFMFTSCIDRFQPEVDKYEGLLVVDGGISNQPGPYTIKLNRSIGVYDYDVNYEPIQNAQVSILEENGSTYALSEVEYGVYQTDSSALRGIPGKSYSLHIQLPNGEEYETPFEEMLEPTPITEIDEVIEYHYSIDEEAQIPGFQFYISAPEGAYEENYYLWRCQVTYEYHADYPLDYVYAGTLEEFPNPDSFKICWRTFDVDELYTLSTADFASKAVERVPILFQRIDTKIASVRFSLFTQQLSINKSAYTFYNSIKNQIANSGSLYNSQPYQIRGNVRNVNDEDEPVLGYFLVAASAQARIFVDKPTDPDIELEKCGVDAVGVGPALASPPAAWPIYFTGYFGGILLSFDGCLDCREIGGTIIKPDFWID